MFFTWRNVQKIWDLVTQLAPLCLGGELVGMSVNNGVGARSWDWLCVAPSVRSSKDNRAGWSPRVCWTDPSVFHFLWWFSPVRIFLFFFLLPTTFPGMRHLLGCSAPKWICWLCTDKHMVKCKADFMLLTETYSAWPTLDSCQRACGPPRKLKKELDCENTK